MNTDVDNARGNCFNFCSSPRPFWPQLTQPDGTGTTVIDIYLCYGDHKEQSPEKTDTRTETDDTETETSDIDDSDDSEDVMIQV